jgi:hypothetical protein
MALYKYGFISRRNTGKKIKAIESKIRANVSDILIKRVVFYA